MACDGPLYHSPIESPPVNEVRDQEQVLVASPLVFPCVADFMM
jgi:hypothetical protein